MLVAMNMSLRCAPSKTIDFMTARWAYLDHAFLDHVSRRIIKTNAMASREWFYDISGKPPATILSGNKGGGGAGTRFPVL